jgi:hypothetical protein
MKLYTEEQVRDCMSKSFAEGVCFGAAPMYKNESFDEIIKLQCPIELPSDEEMYQEAKSKGGLFVDWNMYETSAFVMGAQWMRDKIKGGNK